MIDFRYHALSLAAVFVALALGLLLGVTLGDTNIISDVRGDLERSLKTDLNDARTESSERKDQLEQQNEFISSAYPQLVAGRLTGQRAATIGSADVAQSTLKSVTAAVEPAGADLAYIAQLVAQPSYKQIAEELGVSQLIEGDEPTAAEADQLGRAVGRRLGRGRDKTTMRRFVFSRLSGDITRVRLVSYARQVPVEEGESAEDAAKLETDPEKVYDGFERGVVAGLTQQVDRVAGVESTSTVPSNIKWYNSLGLSTVDNIQDFSGRYALVNIFSGAKGDYGVKDSADSIVPQVP